MTLSPSLPGMEAFPASGELFVRVSLSHKGGTQYRAEVWTKWRSGINGGWVVGLFDTRHAAYRAAHAFLATDPVPADHITKSSRFATDGWIWGRHRREECGEYVRRVKGQRYQLRWWIELEYGGSINCGLYPTENEANRVRRLLEEECRKVPGRGKTSASLWEAMKPLIARGVMPAKLLPKYVCRTKEGALIVRFRKGGEVYELKDNFATPEVAHCAAVAFIKEKFGENPRCASAVRRVARGVGDARYEFGFLF